jgi:hypothetical protein
MRAASLCLLALGGCAQILGLDSPKAAQLSDGGGSDTGGGSDGALTCRGDNFDDNAIDPQKWASFTEGAARVTEQNQRLEIDIDGSPGSVYSGVDGVVALAATDTGVQLEVPQPSPDDTSEIALVLFVTMADELVIGKDNGSLQMIVRSGGVKSSKATAWDPNADRWFRIERSNTNVTFSTSPDGIAWTAVWDTTASFATQSLRPEIYAGHYQQVAPAIVAVDNFEILPGNCNP